MREVTGRRLELRHHPFPFREKRKKEYVIGEALLRWKERPEDEVGTLRNVASDPPDLAFETKDFGRIKIEITESVSYDRDSEAKSAYFVKRLRGHLKDLSTRPPKPSNIFISREPFDFPPMKPKEIDTIARQIDGFFKTKDFEAKYEITQEIVASPIRIAFVPALGAFAHPPEYYDDNLLVRDITGYPIDQKQFERGFERIIEKKRYSKTTADIMIIFQGTIGIVGLSEGLLGKLKNRLISDLAYEGIYIVEITEFPSEYWVHTITIREHPLFARRSVQSERR